MKKKSPPKLRVLYITPSLSTKWGGPPRVAVQLAEAVQKKGLSCTIYTIDAPPKDTTISSRFINISNFSIGWQAHWWPAYSIDLSQTLTREAKLFDIIHIHELWHYANFAAYRTAIRQKIPYIITIHGALEDWALNYKARKKQLYMWLVQRRILKKANGLHVFTEWEAKRLRRLDGFRRIAVIPNGIDMEGLSNLPPREKFEMIYPELRGKKVLLFLGRIHPIKG